MNEYSLTRKLMGSVFELIVCCTSPEEANKYLNLGLNEIERIEKLLSEFLPETATTLINNNAGIAPVIVNDEVFWLLERCIAVSALTQGAFDITIGPLKKLYQFKNTEFRFPTTKDIQEKLKLVGYKKINLNREKKEVFLTQENMRISFAAIGKGYAADCVKKLWLKNKLSSGVISASGDLTVIGHKPDGSAWKIGIANPDQKEKMLLYIPIEDASVATSGDYEQFFMHQGTRFSHNINPITGLPVKSIKSVTVISQTAELCDAFATAVYVMGLDIGMHFINQLQDTHCILVDESLNCHYSNKIEMNHED
jgi:thiamine biosynthesis lipoprotein